MSTDKLIVSLLLLSQTAAAQAEVEPGNFSRSLTAGSDYRFPFTVEWQGQKEADLSLDYSIKAEKTSLEGIRAHISEKSIALKSGESKEFYLVLNTSFGMKSDRFMISVRAESDTPAENETSISETGRTSDEETGGSIPGVDRTGEESSREKNSGKEEELEKEENKSEKESKSNTSGTEDSGNSPEPDNSGGTGVFSNSASLRPYLALILFGLLFILMAREM